MGTTGKNNINNLIETSIYENKLYKIKGSIPIDIVNKIIKSLCKLKIKFEEKTILGFGFFMKISDTKQYLITNYHIISPESKKMKIELEIWNKKKFKIKLSKRHIKFFPEPKDITIIEIKSNDEIFSSIEFLNYDLNYKLGYMIYKNIDIFTLVNPLDEIPTFSTAKIININNFEFEYIIQDDNYSSGCPIILLNNNPNLIQVIGINKESNNSNDLKYGTFIGEIFFEDLNKNNNCIIAELNIKEDDINKDIRIINSYEEYQRSINPNKVFDESVKEEMNEEEIKTM